MKKLLIIPLLASATTLSGCAGVVLGAAATAGYFAVQERGAQQALIDTSITTRIRDRLVGANYKFLTDIGITVVNRNVLLTGVVANKASADEVVAIAQSVQDVNNIYNEIIVGSESQLGQGAQDAAIATQLRTKLLTAEGVFSVNYLVDVVLGNVYISGIAQTEEEKIRALHAARTVRGVRKVHDYIQVEIISPKRILGDALPTEAPNPQPLNDD